jgi:hypothetical protein
VCRWRATYRWKDLDEVYNFALGLIQIWGLHTKLWAPKITGVPTLGISRLPFGSFETKWHLGVGPVARHKVYYKGEVVTSPKSKLGWVLIVRGCPWLVCALKCSSYALTNLLFGLCRSVWMIELFVNLPSPIPELQHAPLPLKVLRAKKHAPTPSPSVVFTLRLIVESIKELGVHHMVSELW